MAATYADNLRKNADLSALDDDLEDTKTAGFVWQVRDFMKNWRAKAKDIEQKEGHVFQKRQMQVHPDDDWDSELTQTSPPWMQTAATVVKVRLRFFYFRFRR